MRGDDELSGSLFSYIDLEDRVRADHPLRPIREIANAALAALSDPERTDEAVAVMLAEYERRRDRIVAGLAGIPGVRILPPEGAFYAFADVSELYGPKEVAGSSEFCERLLTEAGVAAVPGEAFGEDDCVRFSFATSLPAIEEGIRRLHAWASVSVHTG